MDPPSPLKILQALTQKTRNKKTSLVTCFIRYRDWFYFVVSRLDPRTKPDLRERVNFSILYHLAETVPFEPTAEMLALYNIKIRANECNRIHPMYVHRLHAQAMIHPSRARPLASDNLFVSVLQSISVEHLENFALNIFMLAPQIEDAVALSDNTCVFPLLKPGYNVCAYDDFIVPVHISATFI